MTGPVSVALLFVHAAGASGSVASGVSLASAGLTTEGTVWLLVGGAFAGLAALTRGSWPD